MKVLLVSHFFPPTHTSGAENYTYGLAQALSDCGHTVRVFCCGDWDRGPQHFNGISTEQSGGLTVQRLHLNWTKAPDPNRYLYNNPVAAKAILEVLKDFAPDVVHITSCLTLSSSIIPAIKQMKLPVVLTLVDFWFVCPTLQLLHKDGHLCDGKTTAWDCLRCLLYNQKVYRWPSTVLPDNVIRPTLTTASRHRTFSRARSLRGLALDMDERKALMQDRLGQCDVILAPSQFLADVHGRIFPSLSFRTRVYGLDYLALKGDPKRAEPSGKQLRFCYLGQIIPVKGVDVLVSAFRQVSERFPNVFLDVWGDLESDREYGNRVRELAQGCDTIRLRGRFPREELGNVLRAADVVVVPSLWYENTPLVILEAFAAGKPVIASDLGSMPEVVEDGVSGLLFSVGSAEHLAQQMARLVETPHLLAHLESGIPQLKSSEEEIDELIQLYEELTHAT